MASRCISTTSRLHLQAACVDHVGSHTTYSKMANFIPPDLDEFADDVAASLLAKQHRPALLQAFFQHDRLDLCEGLLWIQRSVDTIFTRNSSNISFGRSYRFMLST